MELTGKLQPHVSAKDAMLSLISHYGNEAANGYAIEFTGEIVANLDIEARLTLCNMAAELGTRYALIAPDMPLLAYIAKQRDVALPDLPSEWAELYSDTDAAFDLEYNHDLSAVEPQVTWGTSPMQAVSVSGRVPALPNAARALTYMQLQPGTAIESIAIDAAFIGSCTNARLSDLRIAAQILKGRKIAKRIKAMCTPGSFAVRKAAEAEGIDQIFKEAGFEWRMPGCSNCAGREGAIWANQRVISSTNRNFENRQGPGTRTHLASPATVAASAIAGHIADPRKV